MAFRCDPLEVGSHFLRVVCAVGMLVALCMASPCAALNLSSDIWPADEVSESGELWLYGEGMARSDGGWVVVTTSLRDPSGGELTVGADLGTGTARAEGAYVLNVNSSDSGDYSTLAVGEDEWEYHGCSVTWLGVTKVLFYLQKTDSCFGVPGMNWYEHQCP